MKRLDSRAVGVLAVGLLLLTAGCLGAGGLGGSGEAGAVGEATTGASGDGSKGAEAGGAGAAEDQQLNVQQRKLIKTGNIELRVENFDAAKTEVTGLVEQYGGFTSDSEAHILEERNVTYKTGSVTLRMPQENFSVLVEKIRDVGKVESIETNSKDVTDRLVDLNARLKNLRSERDRLRELYQNASTTEDVITVEKRLSEVQGEIERLEAKKKSLARRVALSTIEVRMEEPDPSEIGINPDRWVDTPLLKAFLESVNGVIISLRWLLVTGVYLLPYLTVFGLPLAGLVYKIRDWRRDETAEPAVVQEPPAQTDPDGDRPTGESESDTDETTDG